MAEPALMTIRLTIQVSAGYRKALATVHGYDADSRGRATEEAISDGLSDVLACFLDDTIQEHAQRNRASGRTRHVQWGG